MHQLQFEQWEPDQQPKLSRARPVPDAKWAAHYHRIFELHSEGKTLDQIKATVNDEQSFNPSRKQYVTQFGPSKWNLRRYGLQGSEIDSTSTSSSTPASGGIRVGLDHIAKELDPGSDQPLAASSFQHQFQGTDFIVESSYRRKDATTEQADIPQATNPLIHPISLDTIPDFVSLNYVLLLAGAADDPKTLSSDDGPDLFEGDERQILLLVDLPKVSQLADFFFAARSYQDAFFLYRLVMRRSKRLGFLPASTVINFVRACIKCKNYNLAYHAFEQYSKQNGSRTQLEPTDLMLSYQGIVLRQFERFRDARISCDNGLEQCDQTMLSSSQTRDRRAHRRVMAEHCYLARSSLAESYLARLGHSRQQPAYPSENQKATSNDCAISGVLLWSYDMGAGTWEEGFFARSSEHKGGKVSTEKFQKMLEATFLFCSLWQEYEHEVETEEQRQNERVREGPRSIICTLMQEIEESMEISHADILSAISIIIVKEYWERYILIQTFSKFCGGLTEGERTNMECVLRNENTVSNKGTADAFMKAYAEIAAASPKEEEESTPESIELRVKVRGFAPLAIKLRRSSSMSDQSSNIELRSSTETAFSKIPIEAAAIQDGEQMVDSDQNNQERPVSTSAVSNYTSRSSMSLDTTMFRDLSRRLGRKGKGSRHSSMDHLPSTTMERGSGSSWSFRRVTGFSSGSSFRNSEMDWQPEHESIAEGVAF